MRLTERAASRFSRLSLPAAVAVIAAGASAMLFFFAARACETEAANLQASAQGQAEAAMGTSRLQGYLAAIGLAVTLPLLLISMAVALRRAERQSAGAEGRRPAPEEGDRAWFSRIADAAGGVWLLDRQQKTLFANARMAEMLGRSPEEMTGKAVYDFMDPEEAAQPPDWLKNPVQHGPASHDIRFRRADGVEVWTTVCLSAVTNGSGRRDGCLLLVTDISERRRMEAQLRDSERRHRALVESAEDVFFIVGRDGRLEYVNRVAAKILRRPLGQIVGRPLAEVLPAVTFKEQERHLQEVFELGESMTVEDTIRLPTGTAQFHTRLIPLGREEHGEAHAVLGIARDVTARKRMEEALRQSNQALQAVVEACPLAIVVLDAKGNVLQWSPAAERIFGWRADEMVGHPLPYIPEGQREDFEALLTAELRGERRVAVELRRKRKDGSPVDICLWTAPLRDARGAVFAVMGMFADITERKRVEEEYAQKHNLLQAVVEGTTDLVFLKDLEGRYLMANSALGRQVGKSLGEIIGKDDRAQFPPDVARQHMEEDRVIMATGKSLVIERELAVGGVARTYLTTKDAYRDGAGAIVGVIGIARDITERKAVEAALQQSERRYRSLFEDAPIALIERDVSGLMAYLRQLRDTGVADFHACFREHPEQILKCAALINVIDANKAALKLYGAQSKQQLMDNLSNVSLVEVNLDRYAEHLACLADGQTVVEYRTAQQAVTGEKREVILRWSAAPGAQKPFTRMLVSAMDITDQWRVEEALRESEERHRSLFENSPVALVLYDASEIKRRLDDLTGAGVKNFRSYLDNHPEVVAGTFSWVRVLDANRAALELYGAESKEQLSDNLSNVLPPENYPALKDVLIAVKERSVSHQAEGVIQTLAGRRRNAIMRFLTLPGHEETLTMVLHSIIDITDLKRAQEEIARRTQEVMLQRAESLAATGRLAAGVAHEVNNPLQSMKAQLRLLADELPGEVREGKRMQAVSANIDRISQIVRRLLDLHRNNNDQPGACQIGPVVRDLSEFIRAQFMKNDVRIETSITPPDLAVPLSAGHLTQALLNLVLNARDAMPHGGVVRIAAQRVDHGVAIRVSDDGVGIPAENKARIFSPFFSTKGPKGTGLGLSVTHWLVTAAGGTIDLVESKEGKGATFEIRLPQELRSGD